MQIDRLAAGKLLFCALILLAAIAGGGCQPSERAYAEVLLKSRPQAILLQAEQRPAESFEVFRETQARLVKSPFVLNAALRDQDIASLELLRGQPHPLGFLEAHIIVDTPASEFLRVSFDGPRSKESAKIVNAVTDAYLQEVANAESIARQTRQRDLEKAHHEIDEALKAKTRQFKRLATNLQSHDTPQTERQKLSEEYSDRLRKEYTQAKFELTRDRVRLERLLAGAPSVVPSAEEVESAFHQRLSQDAVAAALLARKSVIQLLLASDNPAGAGDQPREPARGLERELCAIEKVFAARQDELRRSVVARLEDASEERKRRQAEIERAIRERMELMRRLENELARDQVEPTDSGGWTIEIESLRDEVDRLAKVDREITGAMLRLKLEAHVEPRVKLYRPAEYK